MAAPEKIYLYPIDRAIDVYRGRTTLEITYGEEYEDEWGSKPWGENNVEYIRKDVFIEKACDAYCEVCGHYPHKTPTHICRQDCDYFENFKRHLKGGEE